MPCIVERKENLPTAGLPDGIFATTLFFIDCGSQAFPGRNVFINHGLTVMSPGSVTIGENAIV